MRTLRAAKRKFEVLRRAHYNTGGLAALRAKAASLDAEDEDDDDSNADDSEEEQQDQRRARSAPATGGE